MRTYARLSFLLLLLLPLAGCGGGGSDKSSPPEVVAISISPLSPSVQVGATQQFTATVTGSTNTAVAWTTAGPGTISATGLYTAPASTTTPASVTVTAKAQADTTKSASAAIGIPAVTVAMSPNAADTILGATQQFAATVGNATDTTVAWSVASEGTISNAGLYQAPGALVTPSSVTVTAKPNADPSKAATATVTIPAVSITLSPGTVTLANGFVQKFTATVTNATDSSVSWELAGKGALDAVGQYTAPATFADGETATVKVTSKADTSKSITAGVTLQSISRAVAGYVIMPDTEFRTLSVNMIDKATGKLRPAGLKFVSADMYTNPNMVATHPSKPFVYTVAGFIGVLGYTLNPNGSMTPMAGSPFSAPNFRPEGMTITPNGKFLYVPNTYGPMWGWSIDQSTGALTSISGSPWSLGTNAGTLVADAGTKHLYAMTAGGYQDSTVRVFDIDVDTGVLTEVQSINAPGCGGSSGMAIDPSGKYLYTTGFYEGVVDGFKIDATTGQLTFIPGSPFTGGAPGEGLAVDPLGTYVVAGNRGGVAMYTIDGATGVLTEVAGSPFFTEFGESSDFHFNPTGSVVYTNEGYTLTSLKVDRANNKLTYLSSVHTRDTGGGTGRWVRFGLAQGPEDVSVKSKFAYVLNNEDKTVSTYTIDDATGQLTTSGGATATGGQNPQAMAMDWYGNFLYVVNQDSNSVSAFTMNHATGALTPVAGSPFATGPAPTGVAVEATGRVLFVGTSGDDSLSQYTIHPTTGALTLAGSTPTGQCVGTRSLVADWRGDYLYQLCPGANKTAVYELQITTGLMSSTSPIQVVAMGGSAFALSPYGAAPPHDPNWHSFAFMVNEQDRQIKQFIVGNVGTLGLASSSTVGPTHGLALDPLGRFVYGTNAAGIKVHVHSIDPIEGALTEIEGSPWSTGVFPIAAAVDMTGRFVYVVNRDSNTVSGFALNQSTGALMPMPYQTFATGTKPVAILIAGTIE